MKKTDAEAFASEYCMSAGDNALRRDQINAAIVSKATANEHSFREACMAGLNDIAGRETTGDATPPPPLPAVDDDTRMATSIPGGDEVRAAPPSPAPPPAKAASTPGHDAPPDGGFAANLMPATGAQ